MNVYGRVIGIVVSTLSIAWSNASTTAALGAEQDEAAAKQFVMLGEQEASKSNWKQAAEQFFQAANKNDQDPVAFYDLGVAYLHLGELEKARVAEEQAVILKPDFVNAHVQLATILSKLGDHSAAEKSLRKALELDPNNHMAKTNISTLLEAGTQGSQRSSAGDNATVPQGAEAGPKETPPVNLPKSSEVTAANQDASPVKTDAKCSAGACAVLQVHGVKRKKSDKSETATKLDEAFTAFGQGKLDATKQMLTKIVEDDSSSSSAYASLGAVVGMLEDYDAEIAKEKIAIELDDSNAVAHSNLAWALAHKGRWEEALREEEKALKLDAKLIQAAVGKAIAKYELGQASEAKQLLAEVITKHNSEALPHLAMSVLLEREGAVDSAKSELDEAYKLNPNSQTVKRWVAASELKNGHWDLARQLYSELAKANQFDGQAHLGFGLASEKLGDKIAALEALQKAVELSPGSAVAHMALGLALKDRGNTAEAAEELKEANKLNPKIRLAEADQQANKDTIK